MEKEKMSAEIRAEAIKIAKEKQKILKQAGVPVTAAVKAELMKPSIVEARNSMKNVPIMDGKIKIMVEEVAIVKGTFLIAD